MEMPLDAQAEADALAAADNAARSVAAAQLQRDSRARLKLPGTQPASPPAGTPPGTLGNPKQKQDGSKQSDATVYQWLLAWLVVILFGILIARTRAGYTVLYYLAALTLLFLVLTNYRWITAAVAPIENSKDLLT